MKRRLFQIVILIIALIAVVTGALGLTTGILDDYYQLAIDPGLTGQIILDSNLRYFSGLWAGLGIVLLWMLPAIERHTIPFRCISVMVFFGATGRLISMIRLGIPSTIFLVFTVMELLFPLLILWQNRLSSEPLVR